jgi:putative Mn2+ efflux pump MntP
MPEWLVPMVVLGAGASLSNFGGAIGLGVLPLQRRHRLEIVALFMSMQVLLPVVGLLIGANAAGSIGSRGNLFAGLLLVGIGGYTLLETRREARDLTIPVRRRTIGLLAFALSLDNLAVGFGLGLLNAPALIAGAYMGLSGLGLTVIGLELGRRLGNRVGERAEIVSGVILVLAGVFIIAKG